jgi:hypothetical protein
MLMGTLPHGYFDEISLGADFYSGHTVFESPGSHKTTDLEEIEPTIEYVDGGVVVSAEVPTPLGSVVKTWYIQDGAGRLGLDIKASLEPARAGSLRLGHLTLNPEAFDQTTLFYRTHNGGADPETFPMGGLEVSHGLPVSSLVSARHAVGITEGVIEMGDGQHHVRVEIDKNRSALVGLVTHTRSISRYLCRLAFSAQELDDTCRGNGPGEIHARIWLSAISAN